MKRLLHISMIAPSRAAGGGGLGIYQSCRAVQAAGEADYCGPLPEESCRELAGGYRRLFPLSYQSGLLGKLSALLHLAPSGAYPSFAKAKRQLAKEHYDVAYIDSSRQGYAARFAKRHGMHVVIRMHNVERDYYDKEYALAPSLFMRLKCLMCRYQEKRSLRFADTVIFITEEDRARAEALYPRELCGKRIVVMPICLEPPAKLPTPCPVEGTYALITGALWFGPNVEGILWFLDKVWPSMAEALPTLSLVIAGRDPSRALQKRLAQTTRVTLVDSPPDMAPYFRHAALYLAPILDGNGMKVKVAEALSYGLPVIGTPHVFIGYRDLQGCSATATTPAEFTAKAAAWLQKGHTDAEKEEAYAVFCRHYSMESACRAVREVIETI
ncbi:MAG: glycosyltransferase [Clostridia bacterium]|nr:glycosyltransferase [Clostridia bacterium]